MNTRWALLLSACAAVFLCGAALATAMASNVVPSQSVLQGPMGIIRTSTLIGTTVLDPQSRRLGRIQDVLLDSQTGQGTFVVLDAEAPGSNHAMLVVPYQALRVSFSGPDNRLSMAIDLRPDQVAAAPQIHDNQWQMLKNPKFLEQARDFYQPRTYTAARPIDNPGDSCPPVPCVAPRSRVSDAWSGWSQSMIDFSSE